MSAYKRKHGRLVAVHGEGNNQCFAAYTFKTATFSLALPDRGAEGFYLTHIKELPEEDVRNLARALDELLTDLDRGVDPEELDAQAAAQAVADYERKTAWARGNGGNRTNQTGACEWHRQAQGHYTAEYGADMLEVVDSGEEDSPDRWTVIVNGQQVATADLYRTAKQAALAAVTALVPSEGGDS
jgi:hypothetical protein